jgi:hypothetical protein
VTQWLSYASYIFSVHSAEQKFVTKIAQYVIFFFDAQHLCVRVGFGAEGMDGGRGRCGTTKSHEQTYFSQQKRSVTAPNGRYSDSVSLASSPSQDWWNYEPVHCDVQVLRVLSLIFSRPNCPRDMPLARAYLFCHIMLMNWPVFHFRATQHPGAQNTTRDPQTRALIGWDGQARDQGYRRRRVSNKKSDVKTRRGITQLTGLRFVVHCINIGKRGRSAWEGGWNR